MCAKTVQLKIDGRKASAKVLRNFTNDDEVELKKGILNKLKTCASCEVSPDSESTIQCNCCKEVFHVNCLLIPLSTEVTNCFVNNPSLWWFCIGCLSEKSNEDDGDDETGEVEPDIENVSII